jgi:hypothetical protein
LPMNPKLIAQITRNSMENYLISPKFQAQNLAHSLRAWPED